LSDKKKAVFPNVNFARIVFLLWESAAAFTSVSIWDNVTHYARFDDGVSARLSAAEDGKTHLPRVLQSDALCY